MLSEIFLLRLDMLLVTQRREMATTATRSRFVPISKR